MSAQNAIISASYSSLIHDSSTDVSSPPEYAKTIFIVHYFPNPELTQIAANRKEQFDISAALRRQPEITCPNFAINSLLAPSCISFSVYPCLEISDGEDGTVLPPAGGRTVARTSSLPSGIGSPGVRVSVI